MGQILGCFCQFLSRLNDLPRGISFRCSMHMPSGMLVAEKPKKRDRMMHRLITIFVSASAALLVSVFASQAQQIDASKVEIETVSVTAGIYMLLG